jgi:CRISPR system Cascade subunit CasD
MAADHTLALCFDAPMQSWGIRSHGVIRDTTFEPTKSGVVGLLAAAMGIEREDDAAIGELARLRLGVRVDREGILERDYHTAQNVPTTLGTGHRTVVSQRYYLADALFLVVLEGDERLLSRVAAALQEPRWPLFFGRKAYLPARPVLSPDAAPLAMSMGKVLAEHAWLEPSSRIRAGTRKKSDADQVLLRTVVECPADQLKAEVRYDQPVSFIQGNRRFAARSVLVGDVTLRISKIPTEKACVSDQAHG